MNIKIGDKKISELTPTNLIDIAIIEGVILNLEYWKIPNIIEFDNSLFSDTIVITYVQSRKRDDMLGNAIVMFFNWETHSFHWHLENRERDSSISKNIGIETIKYLIHKGYDIPIY
jgi:hypothetical protein